jgi:ligand-binding sensor domain-containing protein
VFNSDNSNLPLGAYSDLEMDNDGNIWCTTSRYLIKNDEEVFTAYESPVDGSFYSFVIEPNNDIYVGMMFGNYAFQKFHNNLWTSYDPSNSGIINENVSYVDRDGSGNKFFMGDKGLDILNSEEEWYFREISNSELPNNYIRSMAIDTNGRNAICTSYGIVEYNWEEWSEVIDFEYISQIAYDLNGNLIMVTPQELHIFNGETIETIHTPFYGYIAENAVNALVIDANNHIWMTFPNDIYDFMKGGVFMYDGSEWTTYKEENSGLPHSTVTDILVDDENNLWFTTGGGLAKYDRESWQVYNSSNTPLPSNYLVSITKDGDHHIWVSMQYDIVASFDGIDWNVYESPTYPYTSSIEDIQFDSKGNLWGVGLSKVVKFDMEEWETFDMYNSPLPHNNTISLSIDKNDNIFIGTSINGLYIFNEEGVNPIITKNDEIESLDNTQTIIYPNPTDGNIQIDLTAYAVNKEVEVSLYDMTGQEIYNNIYPYQSQLSIQFPAQLKGVFLLKISMGEKEINHKLIIQ